MIAAAGAIERVRGVAATQAGRWETRLGRWSPPVQNPRFWATQALVVAIALVHSSIEAFGFLPWLGHAYFLPISMFFIPVVYAALYFGLSGAVATALWCTFLSVPNWIFLHPGTQSIGAMLQMAIIDGMAVFVGVRADQQMKARADAETAWHAGQESEARYRGLFETSGEGVVVVDAGGNVIDGNPAAARLLQQPPAALVGRRLDDILAPAGPDRARPPHAGTGMIPLSGSTGETWIEPVEAALTAPDGVRQVVLRDVTAQRRRQLGLETYAAHVVKGQEEERQRIAQELHDDTVQSLVLLWRTLDQIAVAAARNPESAVAALLEARDSAGAIAEGVRGYARGLRPPVLDDLGLTPAIRKLATELTARSGTPANIVVQGTDRRLSPDVELALFRIAQESLRNTEKHARATAVRVSLCYRPGCTTLSVRDDGMGFVPPPPENIDGLDTLGLVGMKERARMAGGTVRIRSRPGKGTLVTARIPDREGAGT
ncbi:MAG: PAS domain-containing protein [Chloroflexi bacterium]|nr:PAS domain-containing protein [Chloroflexota bacterium]